jgi:hypothetical protein
MNLDDFNMGEDPACQRDLLLAGRIVFSLREVNE